MSQQPFHVEVLLLYIIFIDHTHLLSALINLSFIVICFPLVNLQVDTSIIALELMLSVMRLMKCYVAKPHILLMHFLQCAEVVLQTFQVQSKNE